MSITEIISLSIGLVSLIGIIPTINIGYLYFRKYRPARKLLGFTINSRIDAILTTSAYERSSLGLNVMRATTGIGQVEGVAFLSRFLGHAYRNSEVSISISKTMNSRPQDDLIVLGGPSKNEFSERFLSKLVEAVPNLKLSFDDLNACIRILDQTYDSRNLKMVGGVPAKDIAMVVLWRNPFAAAPRRAVFCAGFTSYGTSGAAAWLFNDVLSNFCEEAHQLIAKVGTNAPSFIAIIEVDIVNGGVASVAKRQVVPIIEAR